MKGNAFLRATVVANLQVRVVLRIPVISFLWYAVFKMDSRCEGVKPLPPLGVPGVIRFYVACYFKAVGDIHIFPEPSLMWVAVLAVQGRAHDLQCFAVQYIAGSSTVKNNLIRCNTEYRDIIRVEQGMYKLHQASY